MLAAMMLPNFDDYAAMPHVAGVSYMPLIVHLPMLRFDDMFQIITLYARCRGTFAAFDGARMRQQRAFASVAPFSIRATLSVTGIAAVKHATTFVKSRRVATIGDIAWRRMPFACCRPLFSSRY